MGLFGKSKKEREKEYMSRIDVPSCLKENFTLTVDEIFTIIGVGTVVTGNVETGICRTGDKAYINNCLLYTSPSPRDPKTSRMPSSA